MRRSTQSSSAVFMRCALPKTSSISTPSHTLKEQDRTYARPRGCRDEHSARGSLHYAYGSGRSRQDGWMAALRIAAKSLHSWLIAVASA